MVDHLQMDIDDQRTNVCISYSYVRTHLVLIMDGMQNDWTALMAATKNGHVEVVYYLVDHGAKVDLQKRVGYSMSNSETVTIVDSILISIHRMG